MPISATRVAAASLHAVPRKSLSRMLGGLSRVAAPERLLSPFVSAYCRAYGVELDDYVLPPAGFRTFDQFFTRELKPGKRPVPDDTAVVVSPADGRIEDAGAIDADARLVIKGCTYTVAELLGDPASFADFAGGQFFVVYLSPRDYHRVHAPVTGEVCAVHHVGGTLFPVNQIGVRHIRKLFARNERVAVHQQSALHGRVCTVMVGAIGVGRISLSFDDKVLTNAGPPVGHKVYLDGNAPSLARAQELGTFHLGSTAIVFLRPEGRWEMAKQVGDRVQMGEATVRRVG